MIVSSCFTLPDYILCVNNYFLTDYIWVQPRISLLVLFKHYLKYTFKLVELRLIFIHVNDEFDT